MCDHPLRYLKFENVETTGNSVTVRLSCELCRLPIAKVYLLGTPEPKNLLRPAECSPSELGLLVQPGGAPPGRHNRPAPRRS